MPLALQSVEAALNLAAPLSTASSQLAPARRGAAPAPFLCVAGRQEGGHAHLRDAMVKRVARNVGIEEVRGSRKSPYLEAFGWRQVSLPWQMLCALCRVFFKPQRMNG